MFKFVIFSALVAVCLAETPVVPVDTPEVAQAFAEAQARSFNSPVYNPQYSVVGPNPTYPTSPVFTQDSTVPLRLFPEGPIAGWKVWNGVPAPIVVVNGHVQDTTEVAAEKSKHFSLVADAAVKSGSTGPHDDGQYRHDPSGDYFPYGPTPVISSPVVPVVRSGVPVTYQYTTPLVVANGFIQDTPEVAALKATRLAELRSAGGTA